MLEPLPVYERIRILDGCDDAHHARFDDALHAWTGSADVTAGLERQIERRAAREVAGLFECMDLGVGFADPSMEALSDDHTVTRHDDGADERIRARAPAPALGQ